MEKMIEILKTAPENALFEIIRNGKHEYAHNHDIDIVSSYDGSEDFIVLAIGTGENGLTERTEGINAFEFATKEAQDKYLGLIQITEILRIV